MSWRAAVDSVPQGPNAQPMSVTASPAERSIHLSTALMLGDAGGGEVQSFQAVMETQ